MKRRRALQPHEARYLVDAARGFTASQSASIRKRSVNTVISGLRTARYALGAATTTQAVALALFHSEITLADIFLKDAK